MIGTDGPPQSANVWTFVFTDIEGSTRKWEEFPDAMRAALERHDTLLRAAIERHGGHVFKTVGDAFCAAFPDASGAVAAVRQAQEALGGEDWGTVGPLRVRAGLHSGPAQERGGDYFGPTVNRVARLQGIGWGGQTLLSGEAAGQIQDALPAGVRLKDLGSHRLKDLGRAEHVFQLCLPGLPDDFPPIRSLQAYANNLPLQMTNFVGRDPEMARLKDLLAGHRLVTLTGAGGTGKTRLALQGAAERLEDYGDGVWFVDLAPLGDPALVSQSLAGALGVREEPGRTLGETLTDALRPQKTLLLLDNCERAVGACAALVQTLLQACPGVRVLATSRESLGIAGEQVWRVPPLSQPDPDRLPTGEKDLGAVLLEYDSVRLFVERARAQREGFAISRQNAPAVAQICRRLDGIPLAIELAAARVRVLSAEQIASRLDDRFRLLTGGARTALPRHQTLRALIDWSYDGLGAREKTLLQRLSVFAGGWDLEAAEAACAGEGLEAWEVLDGLTGLADKSLAAYEEEGEAGRCRLLETVRRYAAERLAETGAAGAMRGRHRDYFLALAEQAEPLLRGPEQAAWLSRLETEHDNLRAALAWCEEAGEEGAPSGLRLGGALGRFWSLRGHASEGRQWLEKALTRADGRSASAARALNWAGNLAWQQGDFGAARSFYERSLDVRRELGDLEGVASLLNNLGNLEIVASEPADYGSALALFEESLDLKRRLGDQQGVANSLGNLGNVASELGDHGAARAHYEESLSLFRRLGNQHGIADALGNLGIVAFEQGDLGAARSLYAQSLDLRHRIGDQQGLADALDGLADVAEAEGRPARAVRLWAAADVLRDRNEAPLPPQERERKAKRVADARRGMGEEAFAAAFAEGRALTWEQAVAEARETDRA